MMTSRAVGHHFAAIETSTDSWSPRRDWDFSATGVLIGISWVLTELFAGFRAKARAGTHQYRI